VDGAGVALHVIAAPTPSPPPPSRDVEPLAWTCDRRTSASPNPLGGTTQVDVGQDCAVTAWVLEPTPLPYPTPQPFPTGHAFVADACGRPAEPCAVEAGAGSTGLVVGGFTLTLLLLAALVVTQLRGR
jgi:hypothetical protein